MQPELSLTRRRLAGALALLSTPFANRTWGSTTRTKPAARSAPILNVKKFGAFGDGRLPDLRQVKAAIQAAAEHPGGATVLFPPGEYYFGAGDEALLAVASKLQNVRFVGERATISCKSVNGISNMLILAGCRNVSVEGLTFRDRGLNRNATWLGAAAIRLANEGQVGCENIEIKDCKFDSVLAGVICRESDQTTRCRGIRLTNLTVSHSLYGLNFQHNGDDVVARGLRCDDVKRSYFPYGISNHDIEVESVNNATGMTDVLISCYRRDTTDIRVKLKCRAKRGGDTIVYLDHQNEAPNKVLRNIRLDLDIDDVDCRLEAAIAFRSLDSKRNLERVTNRRWENISIDGNISICDKTKLFDFESRPQTPGTLHIGPRLARHPRLPRSFPGFNVQVERA